jgi:hypothetical protein
LLGWSYALEGRFEAAGEIMEDATAAIGELHMEEPIVAWTRADILRMAQVETAAQESAWRLAIDSAHAKEMRIFELRSTVGLARLLKGRGQRAQALELLAPIHDSFAEGADTFDLTEAKRLLTELSR